MNASITLEDLRFLQHLGEELSSQGNLATAHPLFNVEEVIQTYVGEESDGPAFEPPQDEAGSPETKYCSEDSEENGLFHHYFERYRVVSSHLTRRGARDYIRQNAHNLDRPRIFVASQHRCWDFIQLREVLMRIGKDGDDDDDR